MADVKVDWGDRVGTGTDNLDILQIFFIAVLIAGVFVNDWRFAVIGVAGLVVIRK